MKRERLFYLDFIRAFAVLVILLTHYNVPYYGAPARLSDVITVQIGGIYIGNFGVSLFLIISSAALTYVNQDNFDIKKFYKKRAIAIFPMFWIAYFIAFIYSFFANKGINQSIPKANIIWSILGVDQYVANFGIRTFSLISEWFLGFILIFYVVYPLLRYCVHRYPKVTAVAGILLYMIMLLLPPLPVSKGLLLPTRLPELLFGMYFVLYIKKIPAPVFLVSLLLVVGNTILQLPIDQDLATTIIGISAFISLFWISRLLEYRPIKVVCASISKYSYAIFLIHHMIIITILSQFDLTVLTRLENYILFLASCSIIMLLSVGLYKLHEKTVHYVRKMFSIEGNADQKEKITIC